MHDTGKSPFRALVASLIVLTCVVTIGASSTTAQAPYDRCVNEPALTLVDGNDDGVLSIDELRALEDRFPDNATLQDLVRQAEEDDLKGIRYDGQCDEASGGAAPGAVATGEPGASATGEPGASVTGQPGQSATSVGSDSVANVVCQPEPALALADNDGDGVVSVEEIQQLIDLVGGHAELEASLAQVVAEGITGIRYVDCIPATPSASPAATPLAATPAGTAVDATPESSPTARGTGSESDGGEAGRAALVAGAGGVTVAGAFMVSRLRKHNETD